VSVAAAAAQLGNMPVYLDGLGTVTAYYAVTVRTRVDGQLMNVYFREGQFVNADDLLSLKSIPVLSRSSLSRRKVWRRVIRLPWQMRGPISSVTIYCCPRRPFPNSS